MPGRRRRCGRVFAVNSGDGAGDWGNSIVRKVTPAGIITTVAGGGPAYGPPGDGGPVTGATIAPESRFAEPGLSRGQDSFKLSLSA